MCSCRTKQSRGRRSGPFQAISPPAPPPPPPPPHSAPRCRPSHGHHVRLLDICHMLLCRGLPERGMGHYFPIVCPPPPLPFGFGGLAAPAPFLLALGSSRAWPFLVVPLLQPAGPSVRSSGKNVPSAFLRLSASFSTLAAASLATSSWKAAGCCPPRPTALSTSASFGCSASAAGLFSAFHYMKHPLTRSG